MHKKPNPYNPLNQMSPAAIASLHDKIFESNRVEYTIGQAKASWLKKVIKAESSDDFLCFAQLEEIGNFPFRITTTSLTDNISVHADDKSVHPLWFKSFRKIPFVRIFEERLEEYLENSDNSKPFGMIFPRKGFQNGMIIHTGDLDVYVGHSKCCHLYKGMDTFGINYIVQPYREFVHQLLTCGLWVVDNE